MTLIVCELIVVVCFCLVEFSFASFFLGPGVTLFFPYEEFLVNPHRTRRSNKEFKYLETQLNIMNSQPTAVKWGISDFEADNQFCISMHSS